MESKKPNVIKCDDCGCEWAYADTKITEKRWKDPKDELFIVMSFCCPECNKEYIICIDNEVTLSEKEDLAQLQQLIQTTLSEGKKDAMLQYHSLMTKKTRLLARLDKHRDLLKEAYRQRVADGVLEVTK